VITCNHLLGVPDYNYQTNHYNKQCNWDGRQNLILYLNIKILPFPKSKKSTPLPEVDEFSELSWQATQLVTGQVKGS